MGYSPILASFLCFQLGVYTHIKKEDDYAEKLLIIIKVRHKCCFFVKKQRL